MESGRIERQGEGRGDRGPELVDGRITAVSARFRAASTEARFQQANLPQTRFVLVGIALLAMFGAVLSGYGTYVSFGIDSWVFHGGLLLRVPLALFGIGVAAVFFRSQRPGRLYALNALGLVLGCATIALRMTAPYADEPGVASLFHVSRDGLLLLLIIGMAELLLVPGWFAINALIVSAALAAFLFLAAADPVAIRHPLNLGLAAVVAYAFILGMGNAVQRLRRQTFLVHSRLRDANERLERLARTDPLTGCANRRHFFELGARELERARRHSRPLSVAAIDLDHFKSVNDRYGHATGDRTLEAVVAAVEQELREGDVLGRIGGEEFAVLLPETDAAGAVDMAERLRRRIAATRVASERGPVRVTASFGVADNSQDPLDFDKLVVRADTALYRAKETGRDRVAAVGGAG